MIKNAIIAGTVVQRRDIMDVVCVCQLDTDSFLICYKSMFIFIFVLRRFKVACF